MYLRRRAKNIKIVVQSIIDSRLIEEQIYANRDNIPHWKLCGALRGLTVDPRLGNLPHVSGHNRDVKIIEVHMERGMNNVGIDVREIMEKISCMQ